MTLGKSPFDDASGAEIVPYLAQGKSGQFTANGATEVVISNGNWQANSVVLIGLATVGGTPAGVYQSASTPGTSFGVKSAGGNSSTYNYLIVNL